jgi:hypothetical protein
MIQHKMYIISICNFYFTTLLFKMFTKINSSYLNQGRSITFSTDHVMAELLAFLLHIQEVPGSHLGLETGYPD